MSADADSLDYAYRPSLLGAPTEFRLTGDARLERPAAARARYRCATCAWCACGSSPPACSPTASSPKSGRTARPGSKSSPPPGRAWWSRSGWTPATPPSSPNCTGASRLPARRRASCRASMRCCTGRAWCFSSWWRLLAALVPRALQAHTLGGAAFIVGFLALFLWQGGNFFRRNRPGSYRPDALPPELMPKG